MSTFASNARVFNDAFNKPLLDDLLWNLLCCGYLKTSVGPAVLGWQGAGSAMGHK